MSNIIFRGAVTGLSYYDYGRFIDELAPGAKLVVRPVKTPYDIHAIGVFYGGAQIGWIPKTQSERVSTEIADKGFLYAELVVVVLNHDRTQGFNERLYIIVYEPVAPNHQPQAKDTSMSQVVQQLINTNTDCAVSAGFLEAGRIANNTVVKLASKHLPPMVRGYADTPIGKLVIANAAQFTAARLRPQDTRLQKLTKAMIVEAYQELYQEFDIEQMLDDMLDNSSIKRALNTLEADTPAPKK